MLGRAAKTYRFGGFLLDLSRGSLEGEQGRIELRPKSFEVLRYFVEHPDRLISKDELLSAIWRDVHVTEDLYALYQRDPNSPRRCRADDDQEPSTPRLHPGHTSCGDGYRG